MTSSRIKQHGTHKYQSISISIYRYILHIFTSKGQILFKTVQKQKTIRTCWCNTLLTKLATRSRLDDKKNGLSARLCACQVLQLVTASHSTARCSVAEGLKFDRDAQNIQLHSYI